MPNEHPILVLCRYMQDSIAAEKNFESTLDSFARDAETVQLKEVFAQHARETQRQHERLTMRLEAMNRKPSALKSFFAHMFGAASKPAQIGQDETERAAQNLMIACAAEASEVAMYECLATVAAQARDPETERLAHEIQAEERAAWEKVKAAIPQAAERAYLKMGRLSEPRNLLVSYLEDAVAAERNHADLLSGFSQEGNLAEVQSVFSVLSTRAKAQQARLEDRLIRLGGSASTMKGAVAHLLGFAPSLAQMGHEPEEKSTQNLIMACGAAGGQMGMYEGLAVIAQAAGDSDTESVARLLQNEERDDFEMAWLLLGKSATAAFEAVTGPGRDAETTAAEATAAGKPAAETAPAVPPPPARS